MKRRTVEEVKSIRSQFGSLEQVNIPTAKKLAGLVNDETVDLQLLERLASSKDKDPNTSKSASLRSFLVDDEAKVSLKPEKEALPSGEEGHSRNRSLPAQKTTSSSASSPSSTNTVKAIDAGTATTEPAGAPISGLTWSLKSEDESSGQSASENEQILSQAGQSKIDGLGIELRSCGATKEQSPEEAGEAEGNQETITDIDITKPREASPQKGSSISPIEQQIALFATNGFHSPKTPETESSLYHTAVEGQPTPTKTPIRSLSANENPTPDELLQPQVSLAGNITDLKWTYITCTEFDKTLLEAGIWLFEKPLTLFRPQPKTFIADSDRLLDAPLVVRKSLDGLSPSNVSFNGNVLMLEAHSSPAAELRSLNKHPDFLTPSRLAEYQAVECAGFRVWRHDRDTLTCRRAGCTVECSDWDRRTVICYGCGPKTIIRYCTVQHKLEDLSEHWSECGNSTLLIEQVIDHTTEPPLFSYLCPAIRDVTNLDSLENYFQRNYAQTSMGHYTIIDPDTQLAQALFWPIQTDSDVARSKEMDARIERCLNLALFDHTNDTVIAYLYRLIRECLRLHGSWTERHADSLNHQFWLQFEAGIPREFAASTAEPLCECEWVGPEFPDSEHVEGCRRSYVYFGDVFEGKGMRAF
ncbi:MAG: hypothetical protein Q9190_007579, partial [Brigantiaea leucoxantha]